MDPLPGDRSEQLTDLVFFSASAGVCFVLSLFCVVTPFFVSSDVVAALLLLGLVVTAGATVYLGNRAYRVERAILDTAGQPSADAGQGR